MIRTKLFQGDCLEVMDYLIKEKEEVDAIIADIPYGTTQCKWDVVIPFDEMWLRLNKLIKPNGAIVLFGSEPFSSKLRMSNLNMYRYDWIWQKTRPSNFPNAKKQPMKYHEIISVFGLISPLYYPQMIKGEKIRKKGTNKGYQGFNEGLDKEEYLKKEYKDFYPSSIQKFSNPNNKNVHRTQKPVALMEYLVKTYTKEGETVLDFTMGSGTTGVAAKELNRDFIGIELDKKYFDIAEDRIYTKIYEKNGWGKYDKTDNL